MIHSKQPAPYFKPEKDFFLLRPYLARKQARLETFGKLSTEPLRK